MQPLPFEAARRMVLETVNRYRGTPAQETVHLNDCAGRVLAQDVLADRPYPPLPRSIRDGFAVRASDFPGHARVIGEVRAGEQLGRTLAAGEAVEIMTGAPVPDGADAIIMVEHATLEDGFVSTSRLVECGAFIVPAGAECPERGLVLEAGSRIAVAQVAALAATGAAQVRVYTRPEASILATGDELVSVTAQPAPHQIRNSNSWTLAAQVREAGASPRILDVARDDYDDTKRLIEDGLQSDLLLLSGGVSAGKYDLVEKVLSDLGADFFFDRVLIQPGQPLVFGRVRDRFFFGLPGNPASTMVTFELFARAALDLLAGCRAASLPMLFARLQQEFRHKPGLTRFLPARLEPCGREVRPLHWQGSGDVFALARSNAFLVARPDRDVWHAGDMIEVIPQ